MSANCSYLKIFSDDELQLPDVQWMGEALIQNDLCSIHEVLKNYGNTGVYHFLNECTSGYEDLSHSNNMYMSSSLGSYQTLGPTQQGTIIRKIPVNASNGSVINDRQVSQHDTLDCRRQCLSTIHFRFHDAFAKTMNLNGCHVSFSIVFSSIRKYLKNSLETHREFQRNKYR